MDWQPQLFNRTEDCCFRKAKYNDTVSIACDAERRITKLNIGTLYSPLPRVRVLPTSKAFLNVEFPQFVTEFIKLDTLYLAGLNLNGQFPNAIKNLVNLQFLSIKNNEITGNLDDDLFLNMKNLVSLDLGDNKLSGTIPSSLSGLTNLRLLGLNSNLFNGPLPDLSKITNLGYGQVDRAMGGYNAYCYLNGLGPMQGVNQGICLPDGGVIPASCTAPKLPYCSGKMPGTTNSTVPTKKIVYIRRKGLDIYGTLGIAIGAAVFVSLLIFFGVFCFMKKRNFKKKKNSGKEFGKNGKNSKVEIINNAAEAFRNC
ncbi:hypothetical protein HK099_006944 [Clydaea vesicula]|uniref:Uncharacterized protein n=1 Tax=Clydaea vesicula TaxID=447962 RepID=A0AAD5XYS8_9FUNG|nr:hypothetical protein HK099_006944 [Clydaea vesicula]